MQRYTIFLIDDDRDDQRFFHMAAQRIHGAIDCQFADDGPRALKKLSTLVFIPDIIFIDINMPLMNGLECLREIKKMKPLKDVPLYMYSISADSVITSSCISLGAAGVVKKVASVAILREILLNLFSELPLQKVQ